MKNVKLEKIRLSLNLNAKEFVAQIGKFYNISYRAYTSYESGERKMPVEFLKVLCEHYNVNLNWLIADKGEMFIQSSTSDDTKLKSEVEEILRQHGLI